MKRTLKSVAAIVMVLTLCLGMLTACGASPYVGKWGPTKVAVGGIEADLTGDLSVFGEAADMITGMSIEFKADGTATLNLLGQSEDGKWTEKDGAVYVNDEKLGSIKDGLLIVEADGATMTFAKK